MAVMDSDHAVSARAIGRWGTAARLALGGYMVGSVAVGSFTGSGVFQPASLLLGLAGFPMLLLAGQMWRAHRKPDRLVAVTGVAGHLLTFGVFLVLYTTTWYAPPIGFLSDAALLFFGSSMLLAAYRGYAGCEVLAISNWLLRRDDQVGCVVFDPVDRLESERAERQLPVEVSVAGGPRAVSDREDRRTCYPPLPTRPGGRRRDLPTRGVGRPLP